MNPRLVPDDQQLLHFLNSVNSLRNLFFIPIFFLHYDMLLLQVLCQLQLQSLKSLLFLVPLCWFIHSSVIFRPLLIKGDIQHSLMSLRIPLRTCRVIILRRHFSPSISFTDNVYYSSSSKIERTTYCWLTTYFLVPFWFQFSDVRSKYCRGRALEWQNMGLYRISQIKFEKIF